MKKGWPRKTLGDVCQFRGGGTPSKSVARYWRGGIPWVSPKDMKSEVVSDSIDHISQEAIDGSATSLIPKGSVLMVVRSGILARTVPIAITGRDLTINQDLKALCPDGSMDARFLYHLLDSKMDELLSMVSRGATVHRLMTEQIRALDFVLPPLAEQRRIVGVLDEAFAGLATAQAHAAQNLQNARALFESHLQSVFTHRGKGWVEKRMEDACNEIFAGGDVPKANHSKVPTEKHQIPIYTNGEKNNGLYGYTDMARVTVPSVTISARGTIGYAAIRNESYYPAIRLIVAIPNPVMLDVTFLYYAIENMEIGHSGTSIPQLTVPMVRDFSISFPPLAEQERIVTQLDALAAETQRLTRLYEQKQAALAALKKSLLHQAFTGEL